MPSTATVAPGARLALRIALKVVTPAQPMGAASKKSIPSGMRVSALAGTVTLSAQPPG